MGSPAATAVSRFGVVTRKVKAALSAGWSLQGKTRWAASAWLAMASPSRVRTQPPWPSAGSAGSEVWRTVIRSGDPAGTGAAGVTTRSSPAGAKRAGAPSTVTEVASPCAKSRLIRSSRAVERASMTVTASSGAVLSPE